jgi:cobalamin synthase
MIQKKLHVLRDIQYGPLLSFLIVLYVILTTIALEQLITVRQGY